MSLNSELPSDSNTVRQQHPLFEELKRQPTVGPLTDLLRRFEQLNEIGTSLSSERNIEHLLEIILVTAKSITHADGGTLYRMSEDRNTLRFAIVRNDSLGLAFGGTSAQPVSSQFADLPLYREPGGDGPQTGQQENDSLVAAYAALNATTVNIADAYTAAGFDFSGTRAFDQSTGYRSQSFLTVPLKNHDNQVIGILQLINAIDPASGKVHVFSDADQRLAESLASQAAIALSNRLLINQIEALFESFVSLINLAIDEKSPYTSGHSQRMQALTMLLAAAANDSKGGALAGFSMNEEDHFELKIASLLHDCGKISTPQHIVDKASKLQTIFDRIELIDTRFEIVRRDAELTMLRELMQGAERSVAEQALNTKMATIADDRAFLRSINAGSESMAIVDHQRLREISQRYRWRDETGAEREFLTDDELENLGIQAGTLNAAERETINSHIVTTVRMLESLPWPQHLKHIPEYAGGHHERMDGKGYPKGLTRDEMTVQARIMGIADIFEALTARDRPYKSPMTLSKALDVLRTMRDDGHIDPDLHDVFIEHKVYLDYARRYLPPEQIDLTD